MPDEPIPDTPPCVLCDRRPAAQQSQACAGCAFGLDRDLADWPDLVALLPAAVAPSLQAWREPGARSAADTPLPGGEALNLTAGSSPFAPIRCVPQYRRTRVVTDLTDEDGDPVGEIPPWDGRTTRIVTTGLGDSGRPVVRLEQYDVEQVTDEAGVPVLSPDGDQHGQLPPAALLARWVADWVVLRDVGEVGIPSAAWLRERLPWALRDHPRLAEWAKELRDASDNMRAVLNVKRYVQRYKEPCPRCDLAGTLVRIVDPLDTDDSRAAHVTCGACGTMWTLDEWAHRIETAKELAA
ncbi:MAG TPA: hypothetical protein VHA75_07955 [Rugosimonospora sp.]|nr:hypothetical protein [Rugosimonospora sp.]